MPTLLLLRLTSALRRLGRGGRRGGALWLAAVAVLALGLLLGLASVVVRAVERRSTTRPTRARGRAAVPADEEP